MGMTFGVPDQHYRNEIAVNQPIHLVDFDKGRFWQRDHAA